MDYIQLVAGRLAGENVCGLNLEDDSSYQNFFFTAQGTPERYDGENTIPAEAPDWRAVKKAALPFLEKSKDIKLISVFAQAVLNTEGIEAFSQCLAGLAKLIDDEWQTFYPPLDEDDGDPLERVSGLSYLNDNFIVKSLESTPLASVRGIGTVTLESIERATKGSSDASLSLAQIKGIFKEINLTEVQLLYTSLAYSLKSLQSINQSFIDKAGYEYTVNFERTTEVLQQLVVTLEKYTDVTLSEQGDKAEEMSSAAEAKTDWQDDTKQNQRVREMNTSLSETPSSIESRADVEKCLRLINDYYAQYEPSSPIPVLVNRALKLVNKDFMQIMQNLYPSALPALRELAGIDEDEEENAEEAASDDAW